MALRMRRRRHTADLVRETIEEGRERAGELASRVVESAGEVARDALAAAGAPRERSRRRRRVGFALVALVLGAAAATALYAWWRRREDEEYAELLSAPDRPSTSPAAAPDGPEAGIPRPAAVAPTAVPAAAEPVAPTLTQPWTPSAAPPSFALPAHEAVSPGEPAQRPAWNARREAPLFVLPPRPNVPYRAAPAPPSARAQLPGGGYADLP